MNTKLFAFFFFEVMMINSCIINYYQEFLVSKKCHHFFFFLHLLPVELRCKLFLRVVGFFEQQGNSHSDYCLLRSLVNLRLMVALII